MIANPELWREFLDLLDPDKDPAVPLPDLEELEDLADEEELEEMGAAPPAAGQAATRPACGDDGGEPYSLARTRRERAKTDREELELRKRRGELLERTDAERALTIAGAGMNLYVLGLADREGALIFNTARIPDTTERSFEIWLDDLIRKAVADFIADIERIRAGLPPLNPEMELKDAAKLYAEARDRKKHSGPGHEPEPAKGDHDAEE